MKKCTLSLMLFIGLVGCHNDENTHQSHTDIDDNQLPISAIRTDSSSDEAGPGTQKIGFIEGNDNNLDMGKSNRNRNNHMNDNMQNGRTLSGNARDPGRDQDKQVQERNVQKQDRLQLEQNQRENLDRAQQNRTKQPGNKTDQNKSQRGMHEYASKVIALTNEERIRQGLSALKDSKLLSSVARSKSEDMQEKNYFSHTSPTYGSPFNMMKAFDVSFAAAGENIARGQRSPQQVVDAWMEKEEHRKNILDESFTHIGAGYASDGNYWTQMFIEK
ncbi:CAP domain-containing protein [Lentibacillus sp.]|uniref:CAP domain-containing protein n=1 Tax=Lentibacillus sp. TaxID=1925746 RepID=UPI002B4AF046|nr:CAP domain-containing protein [Lentibacillus sp.]HLS10020.1 CAP domain-containing protein [Lentibacillus sp.]